MASGNFEEVTVEQCYEMTGRAPTDTKWVDVNKGVVFLANISSRLVACQLKATDTSGKSYFAPADPFEALPTMLRLAMTQIGDQCPD